MKLTTLPLALLLVLSPSLLSAGVNIHIDLGLPVAPPLVEAEPGILVVEGFREEVFFHDGWYWCRRPAGWYRAHSPRERFHWVDAYRVPRVLFHHPSGHYRYWHQEERRGRHHGRSHSGHGRSYRWHE